jgi:pilus assembly protein Flp/PilA
MTAAVRIAFGWARLHYLQLKGWSEMNKLITRFLRDDSGVTAIEYGLIAALISVVCIAAMTFAGQQLLAVYTNIGNALAGAV